MKNKDQIWFLNKKKMVLIFFCPIQHFIKYMWIRQERSYNAKEEIRDKLFVPIFPLELMTYLMVM